MGASLFYVDESHDDDLFILSAICVPATHWRTAFDAVKAHRKQLKDTFGILIRKEIHARDLVAGRGKLGDKDLGKWQRSRVFRGLLQLVSRLPHVRLFNVALPVKGKPDPQLLAWDRLINRIERTALESENTEVPKRALLAQKVAQQMPKSADEIAQKLQDFAARAIIVADEGRDFEITRALRKMNVHNPIPSKLGGWPEGPTRNIRTERIIEDPVFRRSDRSHFLQLADCVAFALLKREVSPTPNVARYKINAMFDETLAGICFEKASPADPLGIVRK